ncbi:SAM-dependent methyltransferase [Methanofollis fontis]|uniref:Methyltransferase type 12 n=1 Tax=Methanofollis fontis TaxID=2052832 RepID=A0A483CN35_9EURY|nr:methyltransferase domain-containing protein [Methanofollis fontis]TAJ44032.1 methyltransferase type 12 [Methanofollis fontis]
MDYYDLITISTRFMAIMNPTTPEKVVRAGEMAALTAGDRVIEFGCGYGTILSLWGERFGISGRGIDLREEACRRAAETIASGGLSDRIAITRGDVLEEMPDASYTCAACIGSSHIWGGFCGALEAMGEWIGDAGRIVIGERYWERASVPPEFSREWGDVLTEYEILSAAGEAGYEVRGVLRATADDWDAYESGNWGGLLAWMAENPDDPALPGVRDYLHRIQDEYAGYGREYMGFALFVLVPASPAP